MYEYLENKRSRPAPPFSSAAPPSPTFLPALRSSAPPIWPLVAGLWLQAEPTHPLYAKATPQLHPAPPTSPIINRRSPPEARPTHPYHTSPSRLYGMRASPDRSDARLVSRQVARVSSLNREAASGPIHNWRIGKVFGK